jgi:hypothetical protein
MIICNGCGREASACPIFGDLCWRNNGCPATPPDRVPIRPNSGDAYPDRCRATWRKLEPKRDRVWPYLQPALYWPKTATCGAVVKFLDY